MSFSIIRNTFRLLWRQKLFTAINILSLAIGISASLVIFMIVHHEFSYEKFLPNRDRIYRVVSTLQFPEMEIKNSGVPGPMPAAATAALTGVEIFAPFYTYPGSPMVTIGDNNAGNVPKFRNQPDIIFADPQYFQLIPHQWLAGTPALSLQAPHQVVLTESRASQYFPGVPATNIPGAVILYNDSVKAEVTGVVKDLDATTDMNFKEFISISTIYSTGLRKSMNIDEWNSVNSGSQFFVQLKQGTDPGQIEKQLQAITDKHADEESMQTSQNLQPLTDIHFNSDYDNFTNRQAHLPTLYGLISVALFLLLLGCINFVNLTTAQSTNRAREVGVRKTMGSTKWQLIRQFMTESWLLTILATLLSIALTPWLLNMFADYIPKEVSAASLFSLPVLLFLLALSIVVCLAAGLYPSFMLSKFAPVTVLKNHMVNNNGITRKALVRKSLTVTQFVIAQFFVIGILIMVQQIQYSLNKDMGFRKDGIITVSTPWNRNTRDKITSLKHEISQLPGVRMVATGESAPAAFGYSATTLKFIDKGKTFETTTEIKYADTTYYTLYGLQLVAGRYPKDGDTLRSEMVINETFAKKLGYPNAAEIVGKIMGDPADGVPIVGVVKDFHFKSLHSPIGDLAFSYLSAYQSDLHILLQPNMTNNSAWSKTISKVEEIFKKNYPEQDFEYKFFDETIDQFYRREQKMSKLLQWAAGLSILISCLGLLGLVIFTTNSRTKEIGVRKVLGASVPQIVRLLSADLLVLVLVAFLIAAPLAWLAGNAWLNDFAYRTSIGWWVFAAAGAGMLLLALLVLSIRTIHAALDNPVKSLRTE